MKNIRIAYEVRLDSISVNLKCFSITALMECLHSLQIEQSEFIVCEITIDMQVKRRTSFHCCLLPVKKNLF